MKKYLLALALLVSAGAFSQTQIIWTDSCISGQTNTALQMANWNAFCALLTPRTYTKVIMKGSFDPVGLNCTDSVVATALANALNTNTDYISSGACNGHVWHNCASHGYQGEVWLDPPSACNGNNCPGPNAYLIRPNISNYNWGGVNTNTCSAPSQRMTLIFEYGTVTDVNAAEGASIDMEVYPNPFSGLFTVALNNVISADLTVTDVLGQVVRTEKIAGGKNSIDLSNFPAGIYSVTVRTDNATATRKITKTN